MERAHIAYRNFTANPLRMALFFALVVGAALVASLSSPQQAYADDEVYTTIAIGASSTLPKVEIEILEDEYQAACTASLAANVRTAACRMRIQALETKLPEQQARSDEAICELYKLQERKFDIMEMLLSSNSLEELIQQTEYIESVSRRNLSVVNHLKTMKEHLDIARASLEETRAAQDERMSSAQGALLAARAARVAKHNASVASSQGSALNDGADWNMPEEEFIAAWAPRLDAYLAGSPLYGQGVNFARSAYRYCIDPRWSAAISNTESSKGAKCIRPYNAWGWGAADSDPYGLASQWGSWEEAIDAHAAGLASGYGYTISIAGAQSYCPSTWQSWYDNTLSEMARI